jgi:hypothetical protein
MEENQFKDLNYGRWEVVVELSEWNSWAPGDSMDPKYLWRRRDFFAFKYLVGRWLALTISRHFHWTHGFGRVKRMHAQLKHLSSKWEENVSPSVAAAANPAV